MPRKKTRREPKLFGRLALAARPQKGKSQQFLLDTDRFPVDPPLTTDLNKARKWSERTGVWKFMRRNKVMAQDLRPVAIP